MIRIKNFCERHKTFVKEVKVMYIYGITAVAILSTLLNIAYDKIIEENKLNHYFYK